MGKRDKQKKVNFKMYIIFNIIAIILLATIFIRMTYAKYTSEIAQTSFDVEFVAGNISISVTDDTNEFVIVPGQVVTKESKVTVEKNSEACYIFVKVTKSDVFDDYMQYEMATEWNELTGSEGVYYCELAKTTADTDIYIFNNKQLTVKDDVTEEKIEELNGSNLTLKFTAYAVQKSSETSTPEDAWSMVSRDS